jgi:hypothetical protein
MQVPKNYLTKSIISPGSASTNVEQIKFSLKLHSDIKECWKTPLSVEVIQQGEKLSQYRREPISFKEAIPVI